MTAQSPIVSELHNLGRRLVGHWTTEATHPQMPGVVITGSSTFEWLDGDRFVIFRSHYEHPDFPDAVSIIGDTDGLRMHYFDSRGVYRLFELTTIDDGWAIVMGRHAPARSFASSDAPFAQRMTYSLEHGDQEMSGKGQLSHDDVHWDDDIAIRYRRTS
jgi:hypothetical protein